MTNEAWGDHMTDEQWQVYRCVLRSARTAGVRFSAGGAFAIGTYTGRWRASKDMDLYVVPEDRQRMIEVLNHCGLTDYFETAPYDRGWIYRAHKGKVIVDIIWSMANRRALVDDRWVEAGPVAEIRGEPVRIVPPEEMIWAKLYIVQRDRCDWTDVLNMIYATAPRLNWDILLERVGEDSPLMIGVLSVLRWLSPGRALAVPRRVWQRLGLPAPKPGPAVETDCRRVELLDTRPWFLPTMQEQEKPAA